MDNMQQYKIKKNRRVLALATIVLAYFCFLSSHIAYAATLSTETPKMISAGERITVDVVVDPQSENINSIEATVLFDSNFFVFNGFSAKQSSIPIWVQEPKESSAGAVHFSGVIPGGLERLYDPLHANNKFIPVVRLFFISKQPGESVFFIKNALILKNDGKGTAVQTTTMSTPVTIAAAASQTEKQVLEGDTHPPDPFTVSLVDRSLFGKTPRLAVFSAEDFEGGIDHYEVRVGELPFERATSPFSLPYRLFSYTLSVRAFDFSGNVRQQDVTISGEKPYGLGIAIGLLLVFILVVRYRFYYRVRQ